MDDLKEVKIIAGAIIGLGVVAAGIYWFVTSHSYLVLLLNVLAGLGRHRARCAGGERRGRQWGAL